MKFFHPSRIKNFFDKHDMNNVFQETTSAIIGIFAGLYAYEKRDEFFGILGVEGGKPFTLSWPESWTKAENETLFTWGLAIFWIIFVIKLLLYFRFLDLNSLSIKANKKLNKLDVNGILQEIATIILGITLGIFSSPVTRSTWLGMASKEDYPNPIPGIIIVVFCLLLKLFLYSSTLNFNAFFGKKREKVINPGALSLFLQKADWNEAMKELCSTLIGIGIGLYLYQSNLIFWPGQKIQELSETLSHLDEKIGSPVRKIGNTFGLEKYTDPFGKITKQVSTVAKEARKVKWVPEIKEENKKYWVIGLTVVIVCILLKLMMYMAYLNFNRVRDFIFATRGSYRQSIERDYTGILDEVVMFMLTSLLGVMIDPIYNNFKGNPTEYPYGYWSLAFLISLILTKAMIMMEIIDFKRKSIRKIAKRRR